MSFWDKVTPKGRAKTGAAAKIDFEARRYIDREPHDHEVARLATLFAARDGDADFSPYKVGAHKSTEDRTAISWGTEDGYSYTHIMDNHGPRASRKGAHTHISYEGMSLPIWQHSAGGWWEQATPEAVQQGEQGLAEAMQKIREYIGPKLAIEVKAFQAKYPRHTPKKEMDLQDGAPKLSNHADTPSAHDAGQERPQHSRLDL